MASEKRDTINRNFAIPVDDAKWLRATAFVQERSQTELIREAIKLLRRQYQDVHLPLAPVSDPAEPASRDGSG